MARSRNYIATPPGATIKEQLIDRGMSQKEFAVRMDMSQKHVSRLINGEVQLTPEVSVRLEIVLGVPARFWNNLEAIYREKLIKVQAENKMEADEKLVEVIPYNEMVRYEWIPKTSNSKEKVNYLRKYFEVVELGLLENTLITKVACKGLTLTDKADMAFLSWVQEAKIIARKKEMTEFDLKKLKNNIEKIVQLLKEDSADNIHKVEEVTAECGVALVFLPRMKGSKLEGAAIADGKRMIIALSEEKKSRDFVSGLLHELAHIVLEHIGKENGISDKEEADAEAWVQEILSDK